MAGEIADLHVARAKNLPSGAALSIMQSMTPGTHTSFRTLAALIALTSSLFASQLKAQSAPRVRVLLTRPGAHLVALAPNARAVFFDELREMGLLPLPTDGGCEDLACAQEFLGLETADVALLMSEGGGSILLTLVGDTEHTANCADREDAGLRTCVRELVIAAGIPVRAAGATATSTAPLPTTPTQGSDATPLWILGASLTVGGVAALVVGIVGLASAPSCVDAACLQYERPAEVPSIVWISSGAALIVAGGVFLGVAASAGGPSGQSARATLGLRF